MRRHGCALILAAIVVGGVRAQPPADGERYPPAPDLPGQPVGVSSAGVLTQKVQRSTSLKASDVDLAIKADEKAKAPEYPASTSITVAPVADGPSKVLCSMSFSKCGVGGCPDLGGIKAWLTHKSTSRQSGKYLPPYSPPMQFKCDPLRPPTAHCNTGGVKTTCSLGRLKHGTKSTMPVPNHPSCVPPSPELEVVPKEVEKGLSFSPGIAPMALPTTQRERVSSWRPK